MKVFYGSAVDEMVNELRGQAAPMVRLHVLPKLSGQSLHMAAHMTALCNQQVFEAVVERNVPLDNVQKDELGAFVREQCEALREKLTGKLRGFEVRRGILQE